MGSLEISWKNLAFELWIKLFKQHFNHSSSIFLQSNILGKSEGSISPIRTPSTSPARTSLSGACSLMFPYSQSPVMDKSPILSPTPGRSPFKSPSVSPSRANVHSPLSFWNCGGLTKKNDGNNISGGNRTFLQQQFDELGAPGSSPSRGLEDMSTGMHQIIRLRFCWPNHYFFLFIQFLLFSAKSEDSVQ